MRPFPFLFFFCFHSAQNVSDQLMHIVAKLRANVFNAKGDEFQQKVNSLKEASDLVDNEISTHGIQETIFHKVNVFN